MSERVAVAVVGCGFFAQNHLHAWKSLSAQGVDLVAVCDVDSQKAQAAAASFGVPNWFTDAAQMFAQLQVDLVDIVTRMDTHQAMVELALANRVAAVVQKPFGPDLAACRAMVDRARESGVFLAVHENFRFERPMREVADVLRSGRIGEPTWARISFRTGYDIFAGQPYLLTEDRFVIIDLGTHVLDLARFFLGEVRHISAETQRRNPRARGEDTATMMLKHTSGAVSIVECTYGARRLPDAFPETVVEIEGTDGAVVLKRGLVMEVTAGDTFTSTDVNVALLPWASRPWHVVQESVLATCSHMIASLRSGRAASTSADDNFKTFALCEAAYLAMSSGHAVALE